MSQPTFLNKFYRGFRALTRNAPEIDSRKTQVEALPKELQFALATSVLDRLAAEGPLPVSEPLKTVFLQREQAFFADPSKGESWDIVRAELFGK